MKEFTLAEIQFQVDEMLFKMNSLAGVSNLPEKPLMYFTDSDTTCGGPGVGAEDGISSGESEVFDMSVYLICVHSQFLTSDFTLCYIA